MQIVSSTSYCQLDGKRFDVLKVVLAVFIVGIHTTPMDFWLRPILRIAVPLFFMMTSYFFFSNQTKLSTCEEKKNALMKFIRRYLVLYAFWFVVLLPFTVICRGWYSNFGFETILVVLKYFLFGSTFRASWFLMASLINVVFVWWASKKIADWWLIALGVLFYIMCCMFSNYSHMIDHPVVIEVYQTYVHAFSAPYNSFPVALLFVMFGKVLAEKSIFISNGKLVSLLTLSTVSLFAEFYFVQRYQLYQMDDCFFSLIPLSLFLFIFLGQNYVAVGVPTKDMRKYSTIIYCCHATIAWGIEHFLLMETDMCSYSRLLYYCILLSVTLILSTLVCYLICHYSKKKGLEVLRKAY